MLLLVFKVMCVLNIAIYLEKKQGHALLSSINCI